MENKNTMEIRKNENFDQGIIRILNHLHHDSARRIVARSQQYISIHRYRVNLKKIRGIVRLLRFDIGEEKYHELDNDYRTVARQSSVLRDYSSQIELLKNLKNSATDETLTSSLQEAIKQIGQLRITEYQKFVAKKQGFSIQQMILGLNENTQQLNISNCSEVFILKSFCNIYQKAKNAYVESHVNENEEIYHSWRKQVKYLMYQLTILKKAWPSYFQIYIKELKKLGSLLGKLHDLHLLDFHLREKSWISLTKKQETAIIKFIAPQKEELKTNIRSIGDRLFYENASSIAGRIYSIWKASEENKR